MNHNRDAVERELVLVGAGHSHVQVLRRWMMQPVPGVRLTCVVDRPEAVYSGMVPGSVAGDYAPHELEIDALPLARRAGAGIVRAAATRIDPVARTISFGDAQDTSIRPPIRYDIASIDVGSTVRGLDTPGVREHALATRPIRTFVDEVEQRCERAGATPRIVVVGGGAAGVEVAFTLEARLHSAGRAPQISVLCAGEDILLGYARTVRARTRSEAAHRGIDIHCGESVVRVDAASVAVATPSALPDAQLACDLAVWATGAAPLPVISESPLPLDDAGFVRVGPTLEVEGFPGLFAVGDCAALTHAPWVPKAGVYAVREGPVLDANLRAALGKQALRPFKPQRDFLTLINLGEHRALAAKWGLCVVGTGAYRLKDWIDRRFMRLFQVLDEAGRPAAPFPKMEGEAQREMDEMPCGGCAAKVGASPLTAALAALPSAPDDASVEVGLAAPDDAALVRIGNTGERVLATIDGFRAFCDDPWLVGRVAAINALSDIWAKGGRPRHALAMVTVPDRAPHKSEEMVVQVMHGIRRELDRTGTSLVGGHTTIGPELFVALSVTGDLPAGEPILGLDGLQPGDALVLTKALGTGVVLAADMRGLASGSWLASAYALMTRDNASASRIARALSASACTDVSGFGLFGHLGELLRASGCAAELSLARLPALAGAEALLGSGLRSSAHEANETGRHSMKLDAALGGDTRVELLFDPQSSGGLLFGVAAEREAEALAQLHAGGDPDAAVIGRAVATRDDDTLVFVRA